MVARDALRRAASSFVLTAAVMVSLHLLLR
jgi:hypothetical protein